MFARSANFLKTKTAIRSALISLILMLAYLLVGRSVALANKELIREVLKLLVTFAALITTVIYAVLVPFLFSEKEKKRVMIRNYKEDCMKVYAAQQFCFHTGSLIHHFKPSNGIGIYELYELYYDKKPKSIADNRSYFYSKDFYALIEKIVSANEQPVDPNEAKLYHRLRGSLPDVLSRKLFMLQLYLYEFSCPAGKGITSSETIDECVFSPIQVEHLQFSADGINKFSYFNDAGQDGKPVSISDTFLNKPDFLLSLRQHDAERYRQIALEGITLSTDRTFFRSKNISFDSFSFDIQDISMVYRSRLYKIQKDVKYIVNNFKPGKYNGAIFNSLIVIVFGVMIPLFLLHFSIEKYLAIISVLCVGICEGTLISFLIDALTLLNDEENLDF